MVGSLARGNMGPALDCSPISSALRVVVRSFEAGITGARAAAALGPAAVLGKVVRMES